MNGYVVLCIGKWAEWQKPEILAGVFQVSSIKKKKKKFQIRPAKIQILLSLYFYLLYMLENMVILKYLN